MQVLGDDWMTLDELLELRKKVTENKEKLRILNHHYNEMLTKKHMNTLNGNSITDEVNKVKQSKLYKVWTIIKIMTSLLVGMLLTANVISFGGCLIFLLTFPIIGAIVDSFVLPKILFGKDYKVLSTVKKEEFSQKDADQLYEEVSDARFEYHRLRKEFEEKITTISISDNALYQEYLNAIDSFIEAVEYPSMEEVSEEQKDIKKLDL